MGLGVNDMYYGYPTELAKKSRNGWVHGLSYEPRKEPIEKRFLEDQIRKAS